jgi:hypothetical protein
LSSRQRNGPDAQGWSGRSDGGTIMEMFLLLT